jgi:hypothetical protein
MTLMKWLTGLLLLLNVTWSAWSLGALQPWDLGPDQIHEPERIENQLRPDALQTAPV